jgi:hypothetical protein
VPRYVRDLLSLAFLSPRIVEAILEVRQPPELTVTGLTRRIDPPLLWSVQERAFGLRDSTRLVLLHPLTGPETGPAESRSKRACEIPKRLRARDTRQLIEWTLNALRPTNRKPRFTRSSLSMRDKAVSALRATRVQYTKLLGRTGSPLRSRSVVSAALDRLKQTMRQNPFRIRLGCVRRSGIGWNPPSVACLHAFQHVPAELSQHKGHGQKKVPSRLPIQFLCWLGRVMPYFLIFR